MLQINGVSKSYGDNTILEDVSLVLNHGDRLGLVGPNGCGKTTLLKIAVGLEEPDRGSVSFQPPDLSVGYLEQGLTCPEGATVGQIAHSDLIEGERQVKEIAERMSRATGDELSYLLADYS